MTAQPTVDEFPANLLFRRELRQFHKGRVRGQNPAVGIGHNETIGELLDDIEQARPGFEPRRCIRDRRRQSNEGVGGVLLAEE